MLSAVPDESAASAMVLQERTFIRSLTLSRLENKDDMWLYGGYLRGYFLANSSDVLVFILDFCTDF